MEETKRQEEEIPPGVPLSSVHPPSKGDELKTGADASGSFLPIQSPPRRATEEAGGSQTGLTQPQKGGARPKNFRVNLGLTKVELSGPRVVEEH